MLEKIEPFGQKRLDYLFGHLIAGIGNALAPRKDGKPYKAEDFLLEFKDADQVAEEQSLAQIENSIKIWVAAANIMHRRELKMAPKTKES